MNSIRAASIPRGARLSIASAIAALLLAATVGPVGAEVEGPGTPSFWKVLSTARQVVIGDVVAVQSGGLVDPSADGRSSRFTLQVRYVLRGTAQSTMEIWNLPSQRRDEVVSARQGDRIALALDGTDFSPPIPANAVAWIKGEPPGSDYETVDVGEVFEVVGRDLADPSIYPPGEPSWGSLRGLSPGVAPSTRIGIAARRRSRTRQRVSRASDGATWDQVRRLSRLSPTMNTIRVVVPHVR